MARLTGGTRCRYAAGCKWHNVREPLNKGSGRNVSVDFLVAERRLVLSKTELP